MFREFKESRTAVKAVRMVPQKRCRQHASPAIPVLGQYVAGKVERAADQDAGRMARIDGGGLERRVERGLRFRVEPEGARGFA